MTDRTYNALFICTGNSARSIIAEAILNDAGRGRFKAFSAGSHPKGEIHPLAIEELTRLRIPTDGLHSKGWEEFAQPGAEAMALARAERAALEAEASGAGKSRPAGRL